MTYYVKLNDESKYASNSNKSKSNERKAQRILSIIELLLKKDYKNNFDSISALKIGKQAIVDNLSF